ncbi:NAD(P)/FAD-dependent oxidoreductase [Psychroflexus sp. ALD_RP9]|uniref:NAD(P)/FAD-dependent oxidoreductase n=1 Tax=Psychroflexus sp. ALD_RP9 TaxID=2777186 RepID=UPI001A8F7D0C|nr:NAD(P)/FAD-dependent oxidoreductase [Psychroflexus sp. ALD_RP9]QSS97001.1 NAD(P)/FAD-dependent oxidoreductase [Psychroflexus sp. ALD_RP9]
MNSKVCIIGGGLAGLTAAIHLSLDGFEVVVVEKNEYPQHKVCGEYVSNEVKTYLSSLGLIKFLKQTQDINTLKLSNVNGQLFSAQLPLGGFGVSRFAMDHALFKHAKEIGVKVIKAKVTHFESTHSGFKTYFMDSCLNSKFLLLAYGKRSNLDKKLHRSFIQKKSQWIGVKAHYNLDEFPANEVQLHNFDGGYCGLSKTESHAINCCYLVSAEVFKHYKSIDDFNKKVLRNNQHLNHFFEKANSIFESPLAIAQVSFAKKSNSNSNALMLGDAAGLIHPLCGNGMAMAIHSAKIAAEAIKLVDQNSLQMSQLSTYYKQQWQSSFKKRLFYGRIFQKILLNQRLTSLGLNLLQPLPFLLPKLVRLTHGQPIPAYD